MPGGCKPHFRPSIMCLFWILLQLYLKWTTQDSIFHDLSSKVYFHSNSLYFYRQVNQKHLLMFKGRAIALPWFDDMIVQFWNIKRQEILWLWFANNLLFVTIYSFPHFSKEFPGVLSFLYINSGKSISSSSTKSDTSMSKTPWSNSQVHLLQYYYSWSKDLLTEVSSLCIQQRYMIGQHYARWHFWTKSCKREADCWCRYNQSNVFFS